jgi:hypothetical protein
VRIAAERRKRAAAFIAEVVEKIAAGPVILSA